MARISKEETKARWRQYFIKRYKRKIELRETDYNMTLEDIAKKLNCTRERVRQIQNSGLNKLKVLMADYKDYFKDNEI